MSADLVLAARDERHEARVVVTREWNRYVKRDVYEASILHADLLWGGCMHGHQTEDAAIRCARSPSKGRARNWQRCRNADGIVLVAEGVIEWRWHGDAPGRVSSGRCRPQPVPDGVMVTDLGPVGWPGVEPRRRRR